MKTVWFKDLEAALAAGWDIADLGETREGEAYATVSRRRRRDDGKMVNELALAHVADDEWASIHLGEIAVPYSARQYAEQSWPIR